MLNNESSLRLNLLRFPLIIGVVFIHAYGTTIDIAGGSIGTHDNSFISDLVRNLISNGIARIAVPMFFLMSGYFFFIKFTLTKKAYIEKLTSRIKTLLIPFLFWNSITLFAIAIAQKIPATQGYFSGKNIFIANFSWTDYLNAIFGIDRMPIAYQFWFIRDLMILVLITPIIHILNKTIPFIFLSLLAICWFLKKFYPISVPSIDATLFFSLGSFLAIRKKSLFAFDHYKKTIIAVYILIVIADVLLMTITKDIDSYLHKVAIISGVLAILSVTKFIIYFPALSAILLPLGNASFFVYAAHEPLLTIIKKITYKIIQPDSDYLTLVLYFTTPWLVVALLVAMYRILSSYFPQFTQFITGGRVV